MNAASTPSRERIDRAVDIASVLLISLATVATAWCGYEAARWGTIGSASYNQASVYRLEASTYKDHANALKAIDVNLFLQYIIRADDGDVKTRDFIARRFRPEMQPAFHAWLATHPDTNAKAPSSPFVMREYRLADDAQADRLDGLAQATFHIAQDSTEQADGYVRLTVLFAAVSFLAGISTKFFYPSHAIVVTIGSVVFIASLIALVGKPIR